MKESDYYPAGSYYDPNAPWNEIEHEEEADYQISLEWTKETDVHDIASSYDEVRQFLADCDEVTTLPILHTNYDDGKLTLWVEDMDIRITVTAIGNCITNKNPQVTEEDIYETLQEQWKGLFSIDGYDIDQL